MMNRHPSPVKGILLGLAIGSAAGAVAAFCCRPKRHHYKCKAARVLETVCSLMQGVSDFMH